MTAHAFAVGPGHLHLVVADITTLSVDAIVNAANPSLAGGGGVDGAIHRAAGPRLLAACLDIVRGSGPLPTGQAVATPGFNLPAAHVIHTVGPIWRGGANNEPSLLASAYRESLLAAQALGLGRVAFPAISCGVYGFPEELAARTALQTLRQGLMDALVAEVTMCLFSGRALDAWREAAGTVLSDET
ncbi:O-acetyl-ADP-ribose deacetylase [Desulfovibrio sulfodismutans]|uniref:O-acetyl-ADP-ribose deacetylase n=1 Tax=Desulfolutivibrio sulfodismutans TaxID=63561 RepID=A0A7K3NMJ9_9BACT|nr:O-acetyl-ADP-ribose deacetylase [Desulfolutivibrio sulfodismutans]NDY57347.1 O-acetyl-ADP-ribose deacetylase [Desulfolutivibrio sulfodismutans]QLA13518.1 O-acetyl-ADP-ribose deacetylase [Desulfolutivibrio sulfodismutans DSM 3696]